MSDRSFVRAGGYAGILLAITSWAAVAAFYAGLGQELFQLLYALIAFWALIGIGAVREVIRPSGQAWSRYATPHRHDAAERPSGRQSSVSPNRARRRVRASYSVDLTVPGEQAITAAVSSTVSPTK